MILCAFIIILLNTVTCTFDRAALFFLTPCALCDKQCLCRLTNQFLDRTYRGIPAYGIKPVDPLCIPRLVMNLRNDAETILYYKDFTVKGLKTQEFQNLIMEKTCKKAMLQVIVNVEISGDLTADFTKISKSFNGVITMTGSALLTTNCDYFFTKDLLGLDHLDLGPETTTCKVLNPLQVNLTPGLQAGAQQDPCLYKEKINEVFCFALRKGYATIVNNIREASKVLSRNGLILGI